MTKIQGGYYIKARKIQDSDIATAPPHVREIWDWLIKEANHEDKGKIKRGQCVRSYRDIQDGLHWMVGWRKVTYSKNNCETAMNWLKNHSMIHTAKTTRGFVITIENYDHYQNPENYDGTYRKHTGTIQPPATINKNEKNEEEIKKIYKRKNLDLTTDELNQLQETFPTKSVQPEYIRAQDYLLSTGKTYKDYLAFFRNWLRNSQDTRIVRVEQELPKASNLTDEQRQKNLEYLAKEKRKIFQVTT